jgi:NADH:ubiquinone oxidoreductase subunit 3 (subunit A)
VSDKVRIALIIAGALIACTALVTYCSPYQSCVREQKANKYESSPYEACAVATR